MSEIKKILIIEDDPKDYKKIVAILSTYDVEYYPSREQSERFQDLLRDYASSGKEADLESIKYEISSFKPQYILLDLRLSMKNHADLSGIKIKKEVIDKDPNKPKTFYLTHASTIGSGRKSDDTFISKSSGKGLYEEMKKIFAEHNIPVKEGSYSLPKSTAINKWSNLWEESILKTIRILTDQLILFSFFLLFTLFSVGGAISLILHALHEYDNPILIAEHVFITFLPLLIIFGLFVFYERSLKQFVIGEQVIIVNYEEASQLMNMTKKLFYSSLISYLFIKFIELITDSKENQADLFGIKTVQQADDNHYSMLQHIYHLNPLYQLALLGGCIVVLIIYYLLLNNHKIPTEKKEI